MRSLFRPTLLGATTLISLVLAGCANQPATQPQTSAPPPGPSTQGAPGTNATPSKTTAPASTNAARNTNAQPAYTTNPSNRPALLVGTSYERGAGLPKQVAQDWSVVFPVFGGGSAKTDFLALARDGGDMLLVTAKQGKKLRGSHYEYSIVDARAIPAHDSTLVSGVCAIAPDKRLTTFALLDPSRPGGISWAATSDEAGQIKLLSRDTATQFKCRWQSGKRPGSGTLAWR